MTGSLGGAENRSTTKKLGKYRNIANKKLRKYRNVISSLWSWQFRCSEGKNQGKNDRWGHEQRLDFQSVLKTVKLYTVDIL